MSDSGNLLRMLEPAVRPGATPSSPAVSRQAPFEQQPFEQLLEDAGYKMQATNLQDGIAGPMEAPAAVRNPLGPLSQVDSICNASLRQILQGHTPDA